MKKKAMSKLAPAKLKKIRRPKMNFSEMGLKPGKVLKGLKGSACEGKSAIVIDSQYVCLTGQKGHPEVTSLSLVTNKVAGKRVVRPSSVWMVGRKSLTEVYDATYGQA